MYKKYLIYYISIFFFYSQTSALGNTKYILVNKSDRELKIFLENGKIKTFSVSLGFEPNGKKLKRVMAKPLKDLYYIERKFKIVHFTWHYKFHIQTHGI